MTQVTVNLTDTFEDWRVKTNLICANQGDIATLTTATQVSLVAAINEIDATSGMGSIVEDTSPQLGNDLDVQTYDIVSTANRPITITPNGSGDVILDGLKYPQADGTTGQFLKTNGAGQLSFATVATDVLGDTSPQLGGSLDVNGQSIVSVSNGNITITPDGTGSIILDGSIVSVSNGNITITPDGTGSIILDGLTHPQADGTNGQVLKTNGSGTLSFGSSITETLPSVSNLQTTWNVNYVVGRIAVFLNGVKLINGSDFTATNGTSVVLTTGVATTDIIEFQVFA